MMTNHDARVILDNLYERMDDGDLKAKITSKEKEALYKAITHVQQAERNDYRAEHANKTKGS